MADSRVCGPIMDDVCANFEFNNSKMTDTWDEIVTAAGATDVAAATANDDGYVQMDVPVVGDRIIRQSKEYFSSKSYKYNTALFTAVLNINTTAAATGTSVVSRVGVFDDLNDKVESTDAGFFFEYRVDDQASKPYNDSNGNATDLDYPLFVGIRYNSTANSLGDVLVTQQSFNVNDLNRHTHIQINDWSQLYTFEIKYNAIGHVEWAIYLDGERILLHKEQDITGIIHTLPHFVLPLRFEITNTNTDAVDAVTPTTDEMRQFHTSMLCEKGSITPCTPGVNVSASDIRHLKPLTTLLYTIDSFTYLPVFSIKLNASFVRNPIRLYEILYLIHKKGPFIYALIRTSASLGTYASNLTNGGSNLTDPGDWVVGSTNRLDYNVTADAIADTTDCIYEQYVDADCHGGVQYPGTKILCSPPPIASNIAGTPDIYTLVVRKMSHLKATAHFGLRWVEG